MLTIPLELIIQKAFLSLVISTERETVAFIPFIQSEKIMPHVSKSLCVFGNFKCKSWSNQYDSITWK